jgi:zinc transporter 5/7
MLQAVLDAHSDQHADKVTSDMLLKIARAYGTGSSHADVEFHGDELGTYPWLLLFGGLFSYLSLEELLKSAFIVSVSANSLLPLNALNLPSVRQASSDSMISSVKDFLSVVWSDSNSRRILIFLSMNFTFMFVELSYGMMTNSLSLISDSGHMLLDCMGLVIGLYASYIARIRPNAQFTYGYGRFEFMSGFVNAVFLIFIAYSVCVEAIERFASPPDIHGDKLVPIAVLGFGINMIGLLFFHDHAHSGSECSHGHSHGNANMSAIYLHILADALGSLGVITSSTLIYFFGWMILDPICSVFISALIFWSVLPLLKSTAHVLLQRLPSNLESSLNHVLKRVCVIEGVLGYHSVRVWRHSSELLVGSVHVRIANDCDAQSVSNQVSTMFREQLHINQMTVQVETDAMSNVMQDLTGQPINVLHAEHAQHEHEHDEHHEHHGHSHDHSHSCGHSHDAHPSIPTTPLPPPRRMSSTAPRPSSASVARPVSVVGRSLIGAPQPSGLNIERLLEGHMALNGTDIPASTAERIESLEEVLSSLGVTESAKGIDSAATAKSDLS